MRVEKYFCCNESCVVEKYSCCDELRNVTRGRYSACILRVIKRKDENMVAVLDLVFPSTCVRHSVSGDERIAERVESAVRPS